MPPEGVFEYYDLSADPGQQNPLPVEGLGEDLKALLLAHEAKVEDFKHGASGDGEAAQEMPEELRNELEALGYLGD